MCDRNTRGLLPFLWPIQMLPDCFVCVHAHVTGFTALTEKFSMDTSMEHGADQLTQTLNHYVGDIVEGKYHTS